MKYGVLHLAAGIDLILKERLRQEDWQLVFSDIDAADESSYTTVNFQSVGQEESLARLEEYCGIEIAEEDKEKLAALRIRRNRLEHFALVDTETAIESVAAQALEVLLDFISEAFADIELLDTENPCKPGCDDVSYYNSAGVRSTLNVKLFMSSITANRARARSQARIDKCR